jgi:hypothetical protein
VKYLAALLVLGFTYGHSADHGRLRHRLAGWVFRRFPGQITCAEFETFLMDYHEGSLPDPQRELFERHLKLCSQCRASLRGYIRSIDLGRRLFETEQGPLPEHVPDHIVSAVAAAMRVQ